MMVADMMFIVYLVLIALGIWGLYMLAKLSDKAKEANDEEAPYKLETPGSVAVSGFGDAPAKHEDRDLHKLLENWSSSDERKPKRKYTKRSKYWTDKRKKAAARKAKKKTRKSK